MWWSWLVVLAAVVVPSIEGFAIAPPAKQASSSLAAAKGGGGFAAKPARKKAKSTAAGLSSENGWVELAELRLPLVPGGPSQAVGRSVSGKPFLVRRSTAGQVVATSVSCGRCEYPLVKSEVRRAADGVDEIECEMCGSKFDSSTGNVRDAAGGGNFLVGGLLRSKPQYPLLAFPVKELEDGRVFVNIEPYSR